MQGLRSSFVSNAMAYQIRPYRKKNAPEPKLGGALVGYPNKNGSIIVMEPFCVI